MISQPLESERLGLRPFTWDDLEFLVQLNANPDVARYLGYGKPRTEDETRNLMKGFLRAYEEDGLGHLAVYLEDSGTLIGRCGLTLVETQAEVAEGETQQWFWFRGSAPEGMAVTEELELGYALSPEFWGHGYATEAALAVRDFAFEQRVAQRLVAAIFPDNVPSKNVARRVGFEYAHEINAFGTIAECFKIIRSDWLQEVASD